MDQRFGKSYKLTNKKLIEEVFAKGERIKNFPLMMRYVVASTDLPAPFQIAISVPKRNFKQAVKRNKIKRLIRESVRKNKHIVEEKTPQEGKKYVLFLIFNDKKISEYKNINRSVESLFQKLPSQMDND